MRKSPAKKVTVEDATARLELLCARSEHCRYELQEKLRRWEIAPEDSEKILSSLEERRFFCDSRFAAAFVRDKMLYNRWGRMKIVMALRAKRIDSSDIEDAFAEVEQPDYERVARDFLTAKARSVKEGFTYEGRTKLYRAGLSRGFESSLVSSIVKDPATWGLDDE